jgi:hypothetical protein
MAGKHGTPEERFRRFYAPGPTDECWPWTGQTSKGHGVFRVNTQRRVTAQRFAYELHVGPIPDGLDIDHMCHNADASCAGGPNCPHRRCVNPAHLKPATRRDNTLRGRSFAAVEAAKTHCPSGHPLSGDNLYEWRGTRHCRSCRRLNNRNRARRAVA